MSRAWRGVVSVNVLVLVALCLGLLNNVLIATLFGLTRRVDAYFAALMVPNLMMWLCIDYLGKNFLPMLAVAKTESDTSASQMTSTVVTIVAIGSTIVTAVLILFRQPIFGVLLPGFDGEDAKLLANYFVIMAPSMVLMAITTFHEYVLQYEERLLQITLIRLSLPAANLAGIVALSPFIGEYCLPVAYLIGHVVVFVLMAIRAPYQYRPSITIRPELERRIFLNAAVVMSTGLIARARSLVMNYLASKLGSGAISALAFAGKITEPLERTAFTGLRMLMFSRASRLHAANNRAALARLYGMGLRACFMVVTPLLAWIVFNSQEIVALMFGHGQFTAEDTARVATTLSALAPVVLFVGVNALLSNAFYAMNTVKVPAIVMPLGTLIYTVCAIPLADLLGTPGIALSSTIATAILCCALLFALGRRVPELAMSRMALSFCGYLALGGAVMTVAVTGLRTLELPELAVAAISLPLGVLVYVGLLWLFRDDMLQRLTTMVRTSRTGDAAA